MLACHISRNGVLPEDEFDPGRAAEPVQEGDAHVRIDAQDPTEDELEVLRTQSLLHPSSIEDVVHWAFKKRDRS